MTNRYRFLAFLGLLVFLGTGCSSETFRFQITVTNSTPDPITVWPVKEGGPYEPQWISPEEYMLRPEASEGKIPGVAIIVEPGKTAETKAMPAKVDAATRLHLRVYQGAQEKMSQLLAINKGTPMRCDINLLPGPNAFVVDSKSGAMRISRVSSDLPDPRPAK